MTVYLVFTCIYLTGPDLPYLTYLLLVWAWGSPYAVIQLDTLTFKFSLFDLSVDWFYLSLTKGPLLTLSYTLIIDLSILICYSLMNCCLTIWWTSHLPESGWCHLQVQGNQAGGSREEPRRYRRKNSRLRRPDRGQDAASYREHHLCDGERVNNELTSQPAGRPTTIVFQTGERTGII